MDQSTVPVLLQGWGWIYLKSSSRVGDWRQVWLTLQNGLIHWSDSQTDSVAGVFMLSQVIQEVEECTFSLSEEIILRFGQTDSTMWHVALEMHQRFNSLFSDAFVLPQTESDIVENRVATCVISIEDKTYKFSFSTVEGASSIAQKLINQYGFDPDLIVEIENSILRSQLQALQSYQQNHKILDQSANVAECRMRAAEHHADELFHKLERIEVLVEPLLDVSKQSALPHETLQKLQELLQQQSSQSAEASYWRDKYDELMDGYEELQAREYEHQQQIMNLEDTLAKVQFNAEASNSTSEAVLAENRKLKVQTMNLRSEILSLQTQITDIQAAAEAAMTAAMHADQASTASASHDNNSFNDDASALMNDDRMEDYADEAAAKRAPFSNAGGERRGGWEDQSDENKVSSSRDEDQEPADLHANIYESLLVPKEVNPVYEAVQAVDSFVVELRVVQLLYDRYNLDSAPALNLTRFFRFTKEFSIIGSAGDNAAPVNAQGVVKSLVYGEISMIFTNAFKRKYPDDAALLPAATTNAAPAAASASLSSVGKSVAKSKHAPLPYAVRSQAYHVVPPDQSNKAAVISLHQFGYALELLGLRLYGHQVEVEYTGSAIACLPEKQKTYATRKAFELFLKQKIIPVVVQMGFMPWPLVYLDQALHTLQKSEESLTSLVLYLRALENCYFFYGGRCVTYKNASKWAHDFGIVPYLVKEPHLFSVFQEIMLWSEKGEEIAWAAFPDVLREEIVALTSKNRRKDAALKPVHGLAVNAAEPVMEFNNFLILVCSVAMQAFPAYELEYRVGKLLTHCQKNDKASLFVTN